MKKLIKTPEQNIAETFKGKKLLFLENDLSFDNHLKTFEEILIKYGIEYTALFDLKSIPFEDILKEISKHDGIVFMTQWVYEISTNLRDYMFKLKDKKMVVEVYISEPTFYYKPKSKHDVYIYTCNRFWMCDEKENEKFYKLSKKPYWDYKNEFDK